MEMKKMKKAKLKIQIIFLKRYITHKVIPKSSMRILSPLQSRRATNVTAKYRYDLLICARNDAKIKTFPNFERNQHTDNDTEQRSLRRT